MEFHQNVKKSREGCWCSRGDEELITSEKYKHSHLWRCFNVTFGNHWCDVNIVTWSTRQNKGRPHIKKIDFFRALPEKGGGEGLARIFLPFFPPCCPLYFDINIMLCDTFWSSFFIIACKDDFVKINAASDCSYVMLPQLKAGRGACV